MIASDRIDAYLHDHLDQFIDETVTLCAQPSISARGEGVTECAALVENILRRYGYDVQVILTPLNPVVIGRLPGRSERTLLFYNHYDVQPPEPLELWTSPPFEPTIRDGALYARGAKDDKGEFIARLAAVEAVRAAHGGELPCGILFVVEGQEEIGSPHIKDFVLQNRELLTCHGSIWEEGGINARGRAVNLLGARGILALELHVRTLKKDAHSGGAHNLPSAAWQLVRALNSLKDQQERVLIDGFYENVIPPSEEDLALIEGDEDAALEETMQREALLPDGIDFIGKRRGTALRAAVFQPTCNIQGITTGYQGMGNKTIVPAEASAKLDFRLVPAQDPTDILKKLRDHLDRHGFERIEIRNEHMMWPYKAGPGNPLVELTSQAAREVYGLDPLLVPLNGGSSPVYAFAGPLDIPVVRAGVGYWDSRTHSPDEHVRLQDFLNAARHIARIVDGFADLPSSPSGG